MIVDIKVILSGKECMCTVKELKAFQKELNELFPTQTLAQKLTSGVQSPLGPFKATYQNSGISL